MKKVKLSNFKPYQKMIFKNGEMILEKNKIEGEINFVQLNTKNIRKIYEDITSSLKDTDNETAVVYNVLPILTDIENDITLEEFKDISETPNEPLTELTNGIIEYMNNLFDIAEKNKKLIEKANSMKNKIEGK